MRLTWTICKRKLLDVEFQYLNYKSYKKRRGEMKKTRYLKRNQEKIAVRTLRSRSRGKQFSRRNRKLKRNANRSYSNSKKKVKRKKKLSNL